MEKSKWSSLLHKIPATDNSKDTYFYASGDNAIWVEYGYDMSTMDYMDLFRVQAAYQTMITWQGEGYTSLKGFRSANPQWRAIQYSFDPLKMSINDMLDIAIAIEKRIGDNRNIAKLQFNSSIVEIPYAWDHRGCRLAIEKYVKEINPDAFWVDKERMSNIPFLCESNGCTEEELKAMFFGTENLAYCGFLCGTFDTVQLDRTKTIYATKYNPPRTWTYRNSRGMGSFDEANYPTASPGGYQLMGVAAPVTQLSQIHPDFKLDITLCHLFDRVRFVEVSEKEVDRIIALVDSGSPDFRYTITPGTFSVAEWLQSEEENKEAIEAHMKHITESTAAYFAKLNK